MEQLKTKNQDAIEALKKDDAKEFFKELGKLCRRYQVDIMSHREEIRFSVEGSGKFYAYNYFGTGHTEIYSKSTDTLCFVGPEEA